MSNLQGILPVNKPRGITAFKLVSILRKLTGIKKIGHAGTLDPFADGVMVMLIGREFTKLSNTFLNENKEYLGTIHLGITTDTYDCEGTVVNENDSIPTLEQIHTVIAQFQGEIEQIPPMFSAKKVGGKKLYELARKGIVIEREKVKLQVTTEILSYEYPLLKIKVVCSKGTYIRSIAHDIGKLLGCGAHLTTLTRTRSGTFTLSGCFDGITTTCDSSDFEPFLTPYSQL